MSLFYWRVSHLLSIPRRAKGVEKESYSPSCTLVLVLVSFSSSPEGVTSIIILAIHSPSPSWTLCLILILASSYLFLPSSPFLIFDYHSPSHRPFGCCITWSYIGVGIDAQTRISVKLASYWCRTRMVFALVVICINAQLVWWRDMMRYPFSCVPICQCRVAILWRCWRPGDTVPSSSNHVHLKLYIVYSIQC